MSLSDTIKGTRQKLFMSQEDFATAIHVSVATINRWENGRSKPNLTAMKKQIGWYVARKETSYQSLKEHVLHIKRLGPTAFANA